MPQSDSARLAEPLCCRSQAQSRLFGVLYRRSRIQSRYSVLLSRPSGNGPVQSFFQPAQDGDDLGPSTQQRMQRYAADVAPLASEASAAALEEAGADPLEIDHLITVSCTGFVAPGVDVMLIKQLGLRPTVSRSQVGFMGCHGSFNGLRIASALLNESAGADCRVLMCAVELCSLHFAYGWDPQKIVANALFADGAAAVVASRSAAGSNGSGHHFRLAANGSIILPDSEDAMTWRICDHGFEMTLSPRVPDLIHAHLRPWLSRWLADHGLSIDTIGSWAVHPGGPRILQSVADCLDLPAGALDDSEAILSDCGNMSSPTILFIVDRLSRRQAPHPCVALGFGPGLAAEAMLLV